MSAVTGEIVATPTAGTAIQTGMGRGVSASGDTAIAAVSAQQTALVQAAYIMATQRPRDMDKIRVNLLSACKRPLFAKAARFKKPVGKELDKASGRWVEKFAEGLSIRFAEEAMRNMGNLKVDSYTVYDDPKKKIIKFLVLELEGNTEWSKTVTIEKTTERTKLKQGQVCLYQRLNSYGDTVFVVEATAAEVEKMEAAAASKAWRDGILKNVPADIKEECWAETTTTVSNADAKDPAAAKKGVIDSFVAIGVSPDRLKDYIGHELETLSPSELEELRGIYAAIYDGEITWAAVADERAEARAAQEAEDTKRGKPGAPAATGGKSAVDEAVEAAKKKREDKAKADKEAKDKAAAEAASSITSGKGDDKATPAPATSTAPAGRVAAAAASTVTPAAVPADTKPKLATQEQKRDLAYLSADKGVLLSEIVERHGVASTAALPFEVAEAELKALREMPDVGGDEPGAAG